MPPRGAYRLAVCRCDTYGCGQRQYIDPNGQNQKGNRVNHCTFKAHQLSDQLRDLSMTSENLSSATQGHIPTEASPAHASRPDSQIPNSSRSTRQFEDPANNFSRGTRSQRRHGPETSHRAPSESFRTEAGPSNRPFQGYPADTRHHDIFDTSSNLEDKVSNTDPVMLFPLLFTASLAVFSNLSVIATTWALKTQRHYVKLIKESGSTTTQAHSKLMYTQQKDVDEIPSNIHTVFSKLNLDPCITILNTCPSYDEVDEPEPRPTTVPELQDLLRDMAAGDFEEPQDNFSESDDPSTSTHPSAPRPRLEDLACSTDNSFMDPDFESQGWEGQLEITFLKTFCRAGNLSSLLRDGRLPEAVNPYRSQLLSIIEPEPFVAQTIPQPDPRSLIEDELFQQLVHRLNIRKFNHRNWIPSTRWCLMSEEDASEYSPVVSTATFVPRIKREGVIYSTLSDNPDNSVVQTRSVQDNTVSFGSYHKTKPVSNPGKAGYAGLLTSRY
ncbi:uncharacterized protein MELLADRAFT_102102 [Melampsora larici-populina 98AG31]|uniref:Uncharacterized protein n=1 Tax=Melampsora larici-populina (strain 98AG31 / pathotype 3-4-7) TaxID=747676 RepID=F4R606_MELLP|nr:uncharacterized protein MELLADRAFT_102102 [Melampsora larici-populina 98AG31]EGG12165.1 hypothetical protein MELLADRAFT_102102 [Melampsora larici-populina 98AG31]